MRALSLSKNETTVSKRIYTVIVPVFLSFILISFSQTSFAEGNGNYIKREPRSVAECFAQLNAKAPGIFELKGTGKVRYPVLKNSGKKATKKQAYYMAQYSNCKSGDELSLEPQKDACEEASEKLLEIQKPFVKGCSSVFKEGDTVQCISNIKQCQTCSADPEGDGCDDFDIDEHTFSDGLNALASGTTISRGGRSSEDRNEEAARFAACPAYAAEGLSDLKKELRENKKELKDYSKDVQEQEDAIVKAQQESVNKIESLEEQGKDLIDAANKKKRKIEADFKKYNRELENAFSKIANSIEEAERSIRAISISRQKISLEARNEVEKVKAECHRVAKERIQQERQTTRELIARNQYSAGGFKSLMRGVGLDRKTKGAVKARNYKMDCLRDDVIKAQIRSVNSAKEINLKATMEQEADIRTQITKLRNEKIRLLRQQPEDAQEFMRDLNDLQNELNQALNTLNSKIMRARSEEAQANMIAQRRLAEAQRNYQLEQNRVDEAAAIVQLRGQFANKSVDADKVSDIFSNYADIESRAQSVINACECGTDTANAICSRVCKLTDTPGKSGCSPAPTSGGKKRSGTRGGG